MGLVWTSYGLLGLVALLATWSTAAFVLFAAPSRRPNGRLAAARFFEGVTAGLLLFALHPVQRAAERFAHVALPHAKPVRQFTAEERARPYREQVRLAWEDGKLGRQEGFFLDRLRERLGIQVDEAARVERDILEG